ncbi:MAG TPA: 3-oxoacyl-ACP reductase FabG [Burkholderiaceae bacterium]|nr:3-oxoacyl-ACP reductase FabG [Burkholderiaceae bacterium]HMX09881.1 3-oxoacyl-ACP reductase FabG [Burkholderiaceae bacterium]HNG79800.1 3-oxoacyl-ACP reductase FabG [Burkholderiaceae bacterium]
MGRLDGRIAVVSGAASGMGQGAALKLAQEGALIEILDRQDATETIALIREAGGEAAASLCDVTDEEQIRAAAQAVEARRGRIDILVNNAGILSGRKPWHELTRAEVDRFLQVNFMGYFLVSQAFYPLLKKSSAGRIINVASRTYYLANPGQMAYVASKGAVMGFTRVLAKELGPENITVNAVAPGMIATEGTLANSPEEAFDRVMQNQAIKKRGQPRHLAGLIAFLASDEAELITGQFMLCDGGGYLL